MSVGRNPLKLAARNGVSLNDLPATIVIPRRQAEFAFVYPLDGLHRGPKFGGMNEWLGGSHFLRARRSDFFYRIDGIDFTER
jgi:hypothetical protein